MKSILVDTSGKFLSVTICENQKYLGGFSYKTGPKMNESLLQGLKDLTCSLGLKFQDIDEYFIIVGPGSFTGLRIGVATMLGITSAIDKTLKGISSLDAAAMVCGENEINMVAKLRGKEFVTKYYNINTNSFSDFEFVDEGNLPENKIILHSSVYNEETLDLSRAVLHDKFTLFLKDYIPFYMRKSEAEICFDNRSNC